MTEPVPFTVAIDMDGVLFNFGESARAALLTHFSHPENHDTDQLALLQSQSSCWSMFKRDWGLEFREFDELMQTYAWTIFGSLNPDHVYDGALQGYRELRKGRPYRVELLTSPWMSAYDDSVDGKMRWIQARINPWPHGINFVLPGECKSDYRFDVAVEDNVNNAVQIANSGRFVIVPNRPWNQMDGPDGDGWDLLKDDGSVDRVLWAETWPDIVELVDACYDRKARVFEEPEWDDEEAYV